ncbi:hypothetical protein D3C81_209300 [compost metagenome]
MAFRSVVQQRQFQRIIWAVAGGLHQRLGLRIQFRLRLLLHQAHFRFEPGGDVRREVIGRLLTGAQHFFGDNFTVDRIRQRFTHSHIVGRRTLGIEGVIIGTELIRGINLVRDIFQQLLVHVFREGLSDIDVAGQITLGGVGLLVDRHKGHFGQHGMRVIPIVFIWRQHQFLIDHPLLQFKRTVTHQVADFGPVIAEFLHHRPVNREQAEVGGQADKVRYRFVQLHFKGVVIQRRYTQLIGRQLAGDDLVGVLNAGQLGEPGKG